MDHSDVPFLSVAELAGLIERKEITPVEVVEAYLKRIDDVNPALNAFITVLGEAALEEAASATSEIASGRYLGPLHGIPVGVKDQIHTRGIRTTDASRLREHFIPDEDATVVANLKKAGAIVLGKLNMTEFAMGDPITSAFGVTHNPWERGRSPGTSSTGSGAATAACLCATSLGEDTGGSVRGPAANCGLAGIRPSWGRVSRFGVDGASWSFDTIGPISRTVEDCAITLNAIAGYDPRDPYTWKVPVPDYRQALTGDVRGIRIGIVKELMDPEVCGVTPEVRESVLTAAAVLGELGAEVREVSLPLTTISGVVMRTLTSAERVSLNPDWLRQRPEDFHLNTRIAFMAGSLIPSQTYYKAQKARTLVRRQVLATLEEFDVLIQPTNASPPAIMDLTPGVRSKAHAAAAFKESNFRGLYSLTGNPALSVCSGFTDGEKPLPLAMQIAGRPFDEAAVLNVAYAYEQAANIAGKFGHPLR